MLKILLCNLR